MTTTIPGLLHLPATLTVEQQRFLVHQVDAAAWGSTISRRRTQHYGYVYDYRARSVDRSSFLGPLPAWLDRLGAFVSTAAGLPIIWEQAIVNEYPAGVGIGEHADARAFGPAVATVSLLSSTVIRFRPSYHAGHVVPIALEPGDITIMCGPARAPWTHEIIGADVHARRLSITFRTIVRPS